MSEPYAAITVDLTGCEWLSRDVEGIEKVAAQGSNGPTEVVYLYAGSPPTSQVRGFQQRVSDACEVLFWGDPTDIPERLARFFEESNETCQALGMTREEAHQLVDYTYGRPIGDPAKEVGSVMVTLAAVCVYADIDMMGNAEADLEKLQRPETIERIRAKRATRHGRGPLPGLDPVATEAEKEAECCEACGVRLEEGDLVYWAIDAGYLHAECCGPERDGYCGPDGEPLKDDEPIPDLPLGVPCDERAFQRHASRHERCQSDHRRPRHQRRSIRHPRHHGTRHSGFTTGPDGQSAPCGRHAQRRPLAGRRRAYRAVCSDGGRVNMNLTCKKCQKADLGSTLNGLCWECHAVESAAWQAKMAIRQDPTQFSVDKLVRLLLTEHWMHECEIVPDYMPPFPREDTQPTCQIKCANDAGAVWSLRYSNGPLQGYFWDCYGDDFHSPELALIAISQSPAPPGVKTVQTHGR